MSGGRQRQESGSPITPLKEAEMEGGRGATEAWWGGGVI